MNSGLDNQGLKGFLPDDISKLPNLQILWVPDMFLSILEKDMSKYFGQCMHESCMHYA